MDIKEQITQTTQQAIGEAVFPGAVVGVVRSSGERLVLPFGRFTYEPESTSVTADTMYDTASLTKSIPTGSLALKLIDAGRLKLTDKLIDYIPEFSNSDRELVFIKHLLTYTLDGYGLASALDGASGASLNERTSADLFKTLLTHPFEKRPGTVFKYTNIPAALLGLVIENITGSTIDALADEQFFKPLGMSRSTFYPERFPLTEIVPTEISDWRGLVQGVVHDESAYVAKRDGRIVGHAGLFSTVPDILNFLEVLLHKGTLNSTFGDTTYFSEQMVEQMSTNQIPELGDTTGLGWELHQPRYMSEYSTPQTLGKTGFTGTLCVCDVGKGIGYVILSNRTYPIRPADSTAIHGFRKKIGEILLK